MDGKTRTFSQKVHDMKSMLTLACTALVSVSCTSPHPYEGSYLGKRGEMIEIKSNGFMYWSPLSKNRDRFELVGALSFPEIKGDAVIRGPSSSPMLGTRVVLRGSGSVLGVNWNDFRPITRRSRASEYLRREQGGAGNPLPAQ